MSRITQEMIDKLKADNFIAESIVFASGFGDSHKKLVSAWSSGTELHYFLVYVGDRKYVCNTFNEAVAVFNR